MGPSNTATQAMFKGIRSDNRGCMAAARPLAGSAESDPVSTRYWRRIRGRGWGHRTRRRRRCSRGSDLITEVVWRRHGHLPVARNQIQFRLDIGDEFAEGDGAIEHGDAGDVQGDPI